MLISCDCGWETELKEERGATFTSQQTTIERTHYKAHRKFSRIVLTQSLINKLLIPDIQILSYQTSHRWPVAPAQSTQNT